MVTLYYVSLAKLKLQILEFPSVYVSKLGLEFQVMAGISFSILFHVRVNHKLVF